ncbi:MAG: leucine-rich repeat domain-containing protein, partial [Cyanobacteria bacterium P01_E01_bin.6]
MSSNQRRYLASPEGVKQLQAVKARLKLTYGGIAQQAGVSANTVSRLFNPDRGKRVSESSIVAIATVLGLLPEAIVSADTWNPVSEEDEAFAEAERRIQKALAKNATETELDLSRLELLSIPTSIGQLSNLTWLDLSQNQLSTVPKELGQLSNLTWLDLSHNQLSTVPKELGQLSNLTRLDLSHNQLTTVPKELGQLSNLTRLYLYHNQLTTVPKELENVRAHDRTPVTTFENVCSLLSE